jgi:7,8-dihydropterin-6-yl-methyl-4-(beta-D-ribofuranosyl)aminobenzene 5'-phosphate synthase
MWQADRVSILVLVENWVDMLLPELSGLGRENGTDDCHCVSRFGLIEHFDPKLVPPVAENGISLLVRAQSGRHQTAVLFDVGLTGTALAHNIHALNVDAGEIDHVVISHGHPDHFGGIHRLLKIMQRPVPIATHPDAFLPRYAVMGDGRTSPFYNQAFQGDALERGGGRPVLSRDALDLGWGVFTTGEIPREVDFEGPPSSADTRTPGLWQVDAANHWVLDQVWDEQSLVIDVRGEGLVVLTGCAHAGVVNTVRRARALAEGRPIRAVMGGFHLGFPTTPTENVDKTVRALAELEVQCVVPMHCSGLRSHAAFLQEMPDRYLQPAVGSVFHFGARE